MLWMFGEDLGISWNLVKIEVKNLLLKPLLSRWAMIPLHFQAILLILPTFSFLLWFSLQRPVYAKIANDSPADSILNRQKKAGNGGREEPSR